MTQSPKPLPAPTLHIPAVRLSQPNFQGPANVQVTDPLIAVPTPTPLPRTPHVSLPQVAPLPGFTMRPLPAHAPMGTPMRLHPEHGIIPAPKTLTPSTVHGQCVISEIGQGAPAACPDVREKRSAKGR